MSGILPHSSSLEVADPELASLIEAEKQRQIKGIELIASEVKFESQNEEQKIFSIR